MKNPKNSRSIHTGASQGKGQPASAAGRSLPSKTQSRFGRLSAALAGAGFVISALSAHATLPDAYWIGGTASYTNAANWDVGFVPNSTNNVFNTNGLGNILQMNPGDPDWSIIDISASGATNSSGAIVQNGPTLNLSGWLHIGDAVNGVGVYTLSNGVINVPVNPIFLGEGPGSTSTLNIYGGTINKAGTGSPSAIYVTDGGWNGSAARTGTINQYGGTLNTSSEVWIGNIALSSGFYNMHGGTINTTNYFVVGRDGGTGTMVMDGGTINKPVGANPFDVADTAGGGTTTGTFTFSGGLINSSAEFWIGNGSGASATAYMSGTATLTDANWIAVGRGGNGTLNLSGGSITKTGNGNITIGGLSTTGSGTINQTGGYVTNTATQTWIGESSTGTWNMNGGTNILGAVILCEDGSAYGTLNLNGGVFQVSSISSPAPLGISTLNFNGGVLQANASTTSFITNILQPEISSGGAIIDSQSYNITIGSGLQDNGGGGLTKLGTGTLTLVGQNSYSGATVVSNGILITGTSSGASGNYTVNDGAGFGVLVQSSGAQFNANSVTLGSSTGASLNFNLSTLGNPTAAPLNVLNTLTAYGTIPVNITSGLPQVGSFSLVKFGSLAGSANFVLGSIPTGVGATLVTNYANNSIDLNITSVNLPQWDGEAGGTWDIGLTTNWINIGSGNLTIYSQGNAVVFNDSALGTTSVNVTTNVTPSSVTISNSALAYTFTGAGQIGGTTSLIKRGSNTLTLLNTNSYTGPTVITGGTLSITNLANGGSPSSVGASSANPTNLSLTGSTFIFNGGPITANRGFSLTGTSIMDIEGNLTLSGLAQTTTGQIFKTGPGTLTLTGVGTNVLSANTGGGAYQLNNGTLVLNGSAGLQTNTVVGEMWVSATTNAAANLVVSNASLGTSSWFALGRGNGPSNFVATASFYNAPVTVAYTTSGSGGAGGGVSLGYANGLPNSATQILNLSGTTSLTDLGGNFNISENAGSTSIINVSNSASITAATANCLIGDNNGRAVLNFNSTGNSTMATTAGLLRVGGNAAANDKGVGAINQSAGTLNFGTTGGIYVELGSGGTGNTTYGSYVLSGGTLNETAGSGFRVGYGGLGSYLQTGGTLSCGRYFSIGGNSPAGTGVATFTGGTATVVPAYRFLVDDSASGTGTLNIGTEAGGNASIIHLSTTGISVGNSSGGNGTFNLNSGTVQLGGPIFKGNSGASAVANLNGGVLQAGVNNVTLINSTLNSVNIFKGGVTVDSLTNLATISANLVAANGGGIYTSGGIISVTNNGGSGYIGSPLVTVSGGSGSGATAISTVAGGVVSSIVLTSPGQGYVAGDVINFAFSGGGPITVASNVNYTLLAGDVSSTVGGLTKIGSGALYLTGVSTYTGSTLVNAGTLGGNGTILSPVTVAANATMAAGASPTAIGTFTIVNTLTLSSGSTNVMKVNKTAGTQDLIQGLSQLNYGGTLVVSNLAGSFAAGDSFKLFNASAYTGSFSAIVPATPGAGLTWDTTQLAVNGTLRIPGGVNTSRTNITYTVSGGNINLAWPTDHKGFRLQVQTNAFGVGLTTNWVTYPNSTNLTSASIPISSTNGSVFFRLVYP